jgi:hypothetical protein
MATKLEDVERIDIIEGPNLDELLRGLKFAAPREEQPKGISVRFDEVVFFTEDGEEIAELGKTFLPTLVGISYLGNESSSATRDDFVIKVKSWTTFVGHYNVHSRKGSLSVTK